MLWSCGSGVEPLCLFFRRTSTFVFSAWSLAHVFGDVPEFYELNRENLDPLNHSSHIDGTKALEIFFGSP